MTRRVIVLVGLTIGLLPSTRSHAGCNAFPPASSTTSVMAFDGARGTLGSPFVIPTETLRITRRTCDAPTGATFPTNPDDVRTVVLVRPPIGRVRAVVLLNRGTGAADPCDSDTFTGKCQAELDKLNPAGVAHCVSVGNYTVQPNVVDIEFPDLHPNATPVRATSFRTAIAVLTKDDAATVCGQLAKANNHCSDAIGAQPELLACIDQIGPPAVNPCGGTASHPVFPEVTLLPAPNDVKAVCHKSIGGQPFCDLQPVDEFRYGLDLPHNILVPMNWQKGLDLCPGQSLRVRGDVQSPSPLLIPDNDPVFLRNTWLESYTFDGRPNVPPFTKEIPPNPALNEFLGTTDEPLSVLRFGARYGECSSSTLCKERCNHDDQCSSAGDTCDLRCVGNCAPCGLLHPCPAGGGPCGKVHDHLAQFANGRWRLVRTPRGFCEDDPPTLCPASSCATGECVSYLLTVGSPTADGCESPAAAPQAAPVNVLPVFQPLLDALGIVKDSVLLATASSDDALALIVPRALLGPGAGQCTSLGMDNVLVAASAKDCAGKGCQFTCPPLGAGALVDRLKVLGTKVSFLQLPEVPGAAPGMFDGVARFFGRMFGQAQSPTVAPGTEQLAFLRILDTASGSVVTTVGEIVISDPRFDPFAVGPSGGTKLLAKVGRCVVGGKTLGIPSFCHPGTPGECPTWATCTAANVVMAMDLSLVH